MLKDRDRPAWLSWLGSTFTNYFNANPNNRNLLSYNIVIKLVFERLKAIIELLHGIGEQGSIYKPAWVHILLMDSILGQGLPAIESVNLFDDHLSNTRREMRADILLGMSWIGSWIGSADGLRAG